MLQSLKSLLSTVDILSQIDVDSDIIDAYLLKRPMAFVEIYDEPNREIERFVDEMRRFFFVYDKRIGSRSAHVFVSRFRSVIEYVKFVSGLDDNRADIFGIFCGYSPEDAYSYCVSIGKKLLVK
jgi:hypothetical protein